MDALSSSDAGGDIRSFLDLILERLGGAITGLEHSARNQQGYNPLLEKIKIRQQQQMAIWENSIRLLGSIIQERVSIMIEPMRGHCSIKTFDHSLDYEDFIELCEGRPVSGGWAFAVQLGVPGLPRLEKLAFIGHRSARMHQRLEREGGPALYWSRRTQSGFPQWERDGANSPFAIEATSRLGNGDEWTARLNDERFMQLRTTDLAEQVSHALVGQMHMS